MKIYFENIVGQEKTKNLLAQVFENDRLAHAYLFSGNEGTGKLALSSQFAKAILCENGDAIPCNTCKSCLLFSAGNHPNVQFVFPHPKSAKELEIQAVLKTIKSDPYQLKLPWNNPLISIDSIREVRRNLSLKSVGHKNRIIILIDAHKMTNEATNAVLKVLEEPPENTYFFLLSTDLNSLLPTIISRCQLIQLAVLTDAEVEKGLGDSVALADTELRLIARMARGNMRRALQLVESGTSETKQVGIELLRNSFKKYFEMAIYSAEIAGKFERLQLKEILESLLLWLRDAFLLSNLGWNEVSGSLTNLDEQENLEKFTSTFPDFQYQKAIKEVETGIRMLERYVQPVVILLILMRKLRMYAIKA